ncbi:hypothetical protein ACFQ9X_39655 [Catenulispora yoronensis]
MNLPPGRPVRPGAVATSLFKVLISENPLNAAPFALPRLGEPMPQPPAASGPRSALTGVQDRLGFLARPHGPGYGPGHSPGYGPAPGPDPADPAVPGTGDWAVATLAVTVRVPGPRQPPGPGPRAGG